MSTREREAWEAITAPPSTSMALVPLRPDPAPAPAPPAGPPRNAHRYFYGMGYAALGLIVLGTFLQPRIGPAAAALFAPAALLLGLGGLGVLVHVLYRPSMPKLRKGLGAIAALGLTLAAIRPIDRMAQEVHAAARIPRLEAFVEDRLSEGRVHDIGIPSTGWVSLNGFRGRLDGTHTSVTEASGPNPPSLSRVLKRDGISRPELVRMMGEMEGLGVREMVVSEGFVTVAMEAGPHLLYVRPGRALPAFPEPATRPLGGGWYLLLDRGWLD